MSKYTVITLDELESTNAYALEFMTSFDDKTVVSAVKQTKGRGRYNRKWIGDDSSNLYMTIVLKPDYTTNYPFTNLTQYLSVSLCKVLEKDFDITPSIKWPNDILVDGCKISGILAESSVRNNKIEGIALGLGVNVNLKQETIKQIDQKATSMLVLKNKHFDVDDVMKKICDCFFENYEEFVQKGFSFIKEDYVKRCEFLGKNITIREENKQYFAQDIDNDGLLLVKDELNKVSKIITGDVLCV